MSTIINATTTNGVVIQPDNSGSLVLQTNSGTTALTIDTSQRAAFVAGTAAAPAITTTGDTNTGIFFPAADTIAFAEGGTEAMRLDSSGNVGIGTTTPTGALLHVSSSSDTTYRQTKTGQSDWATQTLDSGVWRLYSYTASAERMRIDSSGNVLVGTTSVPTNGASGSGSATFNGTINVKGIRSHAGNAGAFQTNDFNFQWTGNARVWVDTTDLGTIQFSSDYRIKRNIETQTVPALERVMALRPVTYQMADYGTLFKANDDIKEGFIAHEVQEVIPSGAEGVKDAENQIQNLRIDAILSVAVKAIQEQQTIINDLKARIETLEAK